MLRSSVESEYRFVALCIVDVLWLLSILKELMLSLDQVPTIYCDNVTKHYLVKNPIMHVRVKHVEIDFHFLREQVTDGKLDIKRIEIDDICSHQVIDLQQIPNSM